MRVRMEGERVEAVRPQGEEIAAAGVGGEEVVDGVPPVGRRRQPARQVKRQRPEKREAQEQIETETYYARRRASQYFLSMVGIPWALPPFIRISSSA